MPVYIDMDGHFVEHGAIPVKVKNVICNNVRLVCKDSGVASTICTCVARLDSLYTMTVEDLDGAVYSGEINTNTKSYLLKQK